MSSFGNENEEIASICCIGAGYVGGPTCSVLAYKCPDIRVNVVDVSKDRIAAWNSEQLPIFEPGLEDIVLSCRGKNLFFSTDIDAAIIEADLIFVSVNTPTKVSGVGKGYAADLCYVEAATRKIATLSSRSKIIVEKSTVPCRTAESMRAILEACSPKVGVKFDILSNPEFLAEGTAVNDLLHPDRVLIGSLDTTSGRMAQKRLAAVYEKWISPKKIISTGLWSSELTKLAANALLAQRVSSVNSLAAICELTGADIDEVAYGCGLDARIGSKFLKAGLGFGGSCFQKDILNLVYLSESLSLHPVAAYWKQVLAMNEFTKERFTMNVIRTLFSTITGKSIALLGFAFKKDTGDIRESPAIKVAHDFLEEGAHLRIYDPRVLEEDIHRALPLRMNGSSMSICASVEEASRDCAAIVVATDWDEFRSEDVDWQQIYRRMNKPAFIFDGRAILDRHKLRRIGFRVHTVGKAGTGEL